MIYFLDTSALVKRYIHEARSQAVRRLFARNVTVAVARITEAESYAAPVRAAHAG